MRTHTQKKQEQDGKLRNVLQMHPKNCQSTHTYTQASLQTHSSIISKDLEKGTIPGGFFHFEGEFTTLTEGEVLHSFYLEAACQQMDGGCRNPRSNPWRDSQICAAYVRPHAEAVVSTGLESHCFAVSVWFSSGVASLQLDSVGTNEELDLGSWCLC